MKLSLNWLKDYVDYKVSVDELVERLTMAGLEVEAIEKVGSDTVLEIEITPNRPDCLNMLGLSREVGAILGKAVKFPKTKTLKTVNKKVPVSVADKKDCVRYNAILFEGVTIAPSPATIVSHLASMGTRSISNAVDITNFLMFETGQPLHVFDYDKIEGGKIIVRRAKQCETLVTLDGVKRELNGEILVIADATKPIAIAGVMGGKDTEVTMSTKNILLEAAHFDMAIVRRGSRALGIRTDSAYRFERNVNAHETGSVAQRAANLLLELTGGRLVARTDINAIKKSLAKGLRLTEDAIKELLGTTIPIKKAKDILIRLGFNVRGVGKSLIVKAPSFRTDINIAEDLIEEIARVIGFDKLPTSLPTVCARNITINQEPLIFKNNVRQVLRANGIDEALSYSMTSIKNVTKCCLSTATAIKVTNPLSIEQEILRPALLPSLMPSLVLNIHRGNREVRLFEIGNTFTTEGEVTKLAILLTGRRYQDWRLSRKDNVEVFDLKGLIQTIACQTGVTIDLSAEPHPALVSGGSLIIKFQDQCIGFAGLLNKKLLVDWDLKIDGVCYAELDITSMMNNKQHMVRYQPLNDFPIVVRDVSIAVKKDVPYESIKKICYQHAGEQLRDVVFLEQYVGDKVANGHKALIFSLVFQSKERTLRDDEVNSAHQRVVKELTGQLAATLR